MADSKYGELLQNPPKIKVKKDAKEVVFTTISCMCDNLHRITFKKNENGEFSVSGGGSALSNWQMQGDYRTDLVWGADDQDWDSVVRVINSGTSKVESVRSR
jgi:hypothetical protein